MSCSILRLPAIQAQTGYSRSTIYRRIDQGLWPRQVRLGDKSVGWPDYEVQAINAARIAGETDEGIRNLVKNLEGQRCRAK